MTISHFEGTCCVCGERLAFDHDYERDGVIDINLRGRGDGTLQAGTWIRHYATAPPGANPDCAVYSSELWEVEDDEPQAGDSQPAPIKTEPAA